MEQDNPQLMLEQLLHCSELWAQFWRSKTRQDCGLTDTEGLTNTHAYGNGNGNYNGKRPL